MELRLIASTFVLIFLAELGDKTQLAALAASAGARSTWSVFVGASAALLLSTLIAVLLGGTIARFADAYRPLIQGVAGCVFLLFGALFIVGAVRARPAVSRLPASDTSLARFALETAADFEATSAADYGRLARESSSAALRELFEFLERDEAAHMAELRGLLGRHAAEEGAGPVPDPPRPVSMRDPAARDVLRAALDHERSAAAFYRALAESARLPALRSAFERLAEAESEHVRRLEAMTESA